ncbi:MAG: serine hydrolase [Lachnospiraceae bacterium]|nr:serine hydrolase [Lachnospiraceae bacterium]
MQKMFTYVAPEQAGVPSEAIERYLDILDERSVNIHSFVMIRKNQVFAEGYYKPFGPDFLHRMYSAGKSFVSIAIGMLEEEGKLKITDKICDYFPDKMPEDGVHPYIAATRIVDMLRMASPHKATTYKRYGSDDWVKSFFDIEPDHIPGTVFCYDTSATHVLSALVERLSGMELMEYLRMKLPDELKPSKEACFLKDPMGVSQGGSGLMCTMHDLAKVAYLCLQGGEFSGRQYIPAEYLKEATKKQMDTFMHPVVDEQQGYGYQFWRMREDGFAMFGMGGQLAVCFPKFDALYVTTADTQGNPAGVQELYNAFYDTVYPYLENRIECEPGEAYEHLKERVSNLKRMPMPSKKTEEILDKWSHFCNHMYQMDENPMGINSFTMDLFENGGTIGVHRNGTRCQIPFGFDSYTQFELPVTGQKCMSCAAFMENDALRIQVQMIDQVFGSLKVHIRFTEDAVVIQLKRAGEGVFLGLEGILTGHKVR